MKLIMLILVLTNVTIAQEHVSYVVTPVTQKSRSYMAQPPVVILHQHQQAPNAQGYYMGAQRGGGNTHPAFQQNNQGLQQLKGHLNQTVQVQNGINQEHSSQIQNNSNRLTSLENRKKQRRGNNWLSKGKVNTAVTLAGGGLYYKMRKEGNKKKAKKVAIGTGAALLLNNILR